MDQAYREGPRLKRLDGRRTPLHRPAWVRVGRSIAEINNLDQAGVLLANEPGVDTVGNQGLDGLVKVVDWGVLAGKTLRKKYLHTHC